MTAEHQIEIELNGSRHPVRRGATVADLIAELGLRPETIAVERNADLVRKASRATTTLAHGDRIEIVTLVGGG